VDFGPSILLIPVAVLGGGAFGAVILFAAAKIEKDDQFFNILGRLVIMPMFLFSGTFFPLSAMPIYLQPIGWVSPLWHATELGREAAFDYGISNLMIGVHIAYLSVLVTIGLTLAMRQFDRRLAK
jgi:lipooligosaccharide transport system permease protein